MSNTGSLFDTIPQSNSTDSLTEKEILFLRRLNSLTEKEILFLRRLIGHYVAREEEFKNLYDSILDKLEAKTKDVEALPFNSIELDHFTEPFIRFKL